MDSANNATCTSISTSLQLQLAKIYSLLMRFSALEVQILQVQQQRGLDDCGLYSIAFALKVCEGNGPQSVEFSQHLRRSHLYNCLQCMKLMSFPKQSIYSKVNIFHIEILSLPHA